MYTRVYTEGMVEPEPGRPPETPPLTLERGPLPGSSHALQPVIQFNVGISNSQEKELDEADKKLAELEMQALAVVDAALNNDEVKLSLRLKAAEMVLDRTRAKLKSVEITNKIPVTINYTSIHQQINGGATELRAEKEEKKAIG